MLHFRQELRSSNTATMKTLKFKTNINCSGCVSSVTPHLNNMEGVRNWKVDTQDPDKVLTIEAEDEQLNANAVARVLVHAGFKADEIR